MIKKSDVMHSINFVMLTHYSLCGGTEDAGWRFSVTALQRAEGRLIRSVFVDCERRFGATQYA